MKVYRGYQIIPRRAGCHEYLEIRLASDYVSYASTTGEAHALIDTYISWRENKI
jgi:hypothetical protein